MHKAVRFLLLAFALLMGLAPAAPALAFAAGHAVTAATDCCSPPPPSCDAPGAACAVEQMCSPSLPDPGEHAQTPSLAGAADATRREHVLPALQAAVLRSAPAAHTGPPLYLRFQRFLL